jgi:hypothetical protein
MDGQTSRRSDRGGNQRDLDGLHLALGPPRRREGPHVDGVAAETWSIG